MSKIFESLYKDEGEIAKLIKPLVDAPGEAGAHASDPGTAADRPPASAPMAAMNMILPIAGSPTCGDDPLARVRTAALHIPAPSPLLPFEDGQWEASEQYRVLRTRIVQHPKQPRIIVVSSPAPGDGKSVSAINLAATLSFKSEARVLLVDADFRKSAVHVQLGLPETPGLADVLRGDCSLEDAAVNTEELSNLYVMCAGQPPENPVELLDSAPWPALCARFRNLFRYVVIDSPPVAAVADFDLIQAPCDGAILVVRPDHTNRNLLRKSLDIVPKSKFLGVVLNCVPDWFLTKDSSSQYYYYSKDGPRKVDAPGRAAP